MDSTSAARMVTGCTKSFQQQHQHDVDAQHAGEHRQTEAANSSPSPPASPTVVCITPGGRDWAGWAAPAPALDVAQRLAVQLDLEIDVAQPVVAVDLRPGRRTAPASPRWTASPARARRAPAAGEQVEVGARIGGRLDDDRHLALRRLSLAALVVVAGGWRCAACRRWPPRSRRGRPRAKSGRPHDQLRPDQAGASRSPRADAGMPRSSRSTCARARPARPVLAGQHQDVLFAGRPSRP